MSTPTVNTNLQKDLKKNKLEIIKKHNKKIFVIDVKKYEETNIDFNKQINIIMLAFFINYTGLNNINIIDNIKNNINSKFVASSLEAYAFGEELFNNNLLYKRKINDKY